MSRFRVLASLFGLFGLLVCRAAHADLYGAEKAYAEKDFAKAFALYREIAEMGHPLGQESLAVMYVNGEGVKRDNVLGYGWALIARENGRNDIAQNIITQIEPHMTDAARKRVAELQAHFGKAALQESLLPVLPGQPVPGTQVEYKPDPDNCTFTRPANPDDFYPESAVRQGMSGNVEMEFTVMPDNRAHNPRAIFGLPPGAFDQPAKKVILNSAFRAKKVNGVAVPCTMRIRVKFTVKGGTAGSQSPEVAQALADARKKSLQGDPSSQMTYALLLQGLGGSSDASEYPIVWNLKAAQAGLPTAQFMVGSFLLNTVTTAFHDERKALIWLNKAADAGQADAEVDLANYLLRKSADAADRARAYEMLDRAATTDHLEAKYRLASLIACDADESQRDPQRALKLLHEVMLTQEVDPTAFEVRAAAHAMLGELSDARNDQKRAIGLASKYGWDVAPLKARLALYEAGKTWTGDLLAQ